MPKKREETEADKITESCYCESSGTRDAVLMNYIGDMYAKQLWQCPECKEVRITNY
jgi:hypothetical protein